MNGCSVISGVKKTEGRMDDDVRRGWEAREKEGRKGREVAQNRICESRNSEQSFHHHQP